MGSVGNGASGNTLIGKGITSSPTFASIGTDSGLTANGVVIAEGTGPFQATTAGNAGEVLMSNGAGVNPSFQSGGSSLVTTLTPQTGTSPVVPSAGTITINGSVVTAGTNPVRTDGTGASTLAVEVQTSQAIAAADATKIGLSNFDSTSFAVAATGFVTLSTTGAGKTITGDSGGALSPASNNWNILGRSGSKTSGSGSTLTVNSPPFADQGGSTTVTLNSGNFATATVTLTTPATAGLLDGDLLVFVATTANVFTIQLAATQVAHIGNVASSAAGTLVSTAIGDSVSLRYQASTNDWWATSAVGNWTIT